jgi:arylsulfatase A-like enzyme
VLFSGPGVVRGDLGSASLYDVSPTLLWAMDNPLPADADGRVLFEAFTEEAAAAHEVREVEAAAPRRAEAVPVGAADPEVESRLRALGYL